MRNAIMISIVCVVVLLTGSCVDAGLVLSEKIMDLSETCAFLSNEAYMASPDSTGYDEMENFVDEPDQALVARKDGYCFVAFRGTTLTMTDWFQNIKIGKNEVCAVGGDVCCEVRSGFRDAYREPAYRADLEKKVMDCTSKCANSDECLVLTGHSQGGAVAAVAGVKLASLNPYVITFGEPPSVDPGCKVVSAERWYRYVNTVVSETGIYGISYDPVPFAPGLGTIVYGQLIILGEDSKEVAYIGANSEKSFSPLNVKGATAHSMVGTEASPGYHDRIKTLVDHAASFPIPVTGWAAPNYCTDDDECASGKCARETRLSYERCYSFECTNDEDCDTGRCDFGGCQPKLGSCSTCEEDSDCISGNCYLFRCTNMENLVDNNCRCVRGGDCASGRCEGVTSLQCEARLPEGSKCNEHSDCLGGTCSWRYKCSAKSFSIFGKRRSLLSVTGGSARTLFTAGALSFVFVFVAVRKRTRAGYERIQ